MESRNICKFNSHRSGDLVCTNFVYETGASQGGLSVASHYQLAIVTEGEGTLCIGGRELVLGVGDLFFVGRGECFAVKDMGGLGYLYITFYGRRAEELAERIGLRDCAVFRRPEAADGLIAFAMDGLHRAKEENLDLFSEAVLLYFLAHLSVGKRSHGELVDRMVMLTNDYFTDAAFSLSALAKELGYDAKYLSSLFKKKRGVGFTEYLRELRIKHAVFLMEQGVASVKNIAVLAGFGDALYFSKVFKGEMGESPSEYIRHLRSE